MSRRVRTAVQRDWLFGFVSCNYIFRSAIDFNITLCSYDKAYACEGTRSFTVRKFTRKAVHNTHLQTDSKKQCANSNMPKSRHVPGLPESAIRLLQNIEYVNRKMPRTQEITRLRRFDLQRYRVMYGVPIFATFSSDEPNDVLLLHLSRTRKKDLFFSEKQGFCKCTSCDSICF